MASIVSPRSGDAQIYKMGGHSTDTRHSFSEEEKVAFTDYINTALSKDADLKSILPINKKDMALFSAVNDGILLCKLINDAIPETIDERVLNKKNLNEWRKSENQTLCINSAKSIGCNVVNIGPKDLIEGKPHLVLGLIWQIVKIGLFSRINLVNHPELYRLLEDGETIEDLLKLPVDQILLRWFNYHLKNANWNRRVKNFTTDIKDGENYAVLLAQIAPKHCNRDPLKQPDLVKRAEMVLENADKIDCRKFVTARDICSGHAKLNLAFVANLFNTWPALEPVEIEIIEETREEKQFRNWMNSLGVDPFVNNIYEDLKDGLVLLQLFDKVEPGIVDWSKVNKAPVKGAFKKVENCNYAVDLGKQIKFSLVGIGGKDIMDGNKMYILAIIWQLMRHHVVSLLTKLGGGKKISDDSIIQWANDKVKKSGKSTSMSKFNDPSLADGRFLIDLCDAVCPGSVDYGIVNEGRSEKDRLLNAKYVISLSRKVGATIFALPEDITEVKNKMIMTLCAGLMAVDYQK